MVAKQIEASDIVDANVLWVMRTVPRHYFVSAHPCQQHTGAGKQINIPLPIGQGQTISQPYIVAFMTEAMRLKSDLKVLETEFGSGYQASVCRW